eukprot:SAG31_NODE_1505_length_8078_cov_5.291390_7_plen_77_part_00
MMKYVALLLCSDRDDSSMSLGVSSRTALGAEIETHYPPCGPMDTNPTRDSFALTLSPRAHRALWFPAQHRAVKNVA